VTAWPKSGWTRAKASMRPTAPSGSGILGLPSRRRLGRLHREARAVLHQHVEIAEFGRLGSRRRGEAIERGQQMAQDANRQRAREVKARGLRPRYVGGDGAEVAIVQQEDERRRPAHHARLHHRAVLGVDDVAVVAGAGLAADRVAAAARAVLCRRLLGGRRPSLVPYVTVTGPQGRRDRRRRAFMLLILRAGDSGKRQEARAGVYQLPWTGRERRAARVPVSRGSRRKVHRRSASGVEGRNQDE